MREIYGDLFAHNHNGPKAICITTNGYVGRDGCNVMGRGTAGEAKRRWPGIESLLGRLIQEKGNRVHQLTLENGSGIFLSLNWLNPKVEVPYHIVSFPTKPEVVNEAALLINQYRRAHEGHVEDLNLPGWMAKSDLDLIQQSAWELRNLVDRMRWESVVVPRPGCSAGERSWEGEVKPLLEEPFKDDRFFIVQMRR